MNAIKKKCILSALVGAVCSALLFGGVTSCFGTDSEIPAESKIYEHKQDIGSVLALYPTPATLIGAMVNDKVNWLLVAHVGIIGHDQILISMSKTHYTNEGILKSRRFSVNMITEEMLKKADYVGTYSGNHVDKSEVFAYHMASSGIPVCDESPLTMECHVVDVYETETFDNFICTISATTVAQEYLNEEGKIDYTKLKPVLFEMPTYQYLRTGEVIGTCRTLND